MLEVSAAALLLGLSNSTWAGRPLPLPMDSFGMPGCTLVTSGDVLVPLVARAGLPMLQYTVPWSPSLVGTPYFHQALVLDPQANAAGLALSNGRAQKVGWP